MRSGAFGALCRAAVALAVVVFVHGAHAGAEDAEAIGPPLQALIDAASPGETVVVPAGVHYGGVTVDKPLELRGEPGAIIDAQGVGDVVRVSSPDVTLRNLTLRNSGYNLTEMNAGVHGEKGADRLHVEDCVMENVAFGIWLWFLEGPRAVNNRIHGNADVRSPDRGDGLRLYAVHHGRFEGNDIRVVRDGVYVDTSSNIEFLNNHFEDLRYGIHYMYSHDGRVVGNTSTGTRSGFALMMSNRLEIVGNRSTADLNYGILLNFVNSSVIADNEVSGVRGWAGGSGTEHGIALGGEGKALFVYNSVNNEIRGNVFADSEMGIHLTAGSENNAIHDNAFVRNKYQVKYVGRSGQDWSHEGRGNYWSDYLGWDLDGDGIGQVPYQPTDGIDRLLWMYPMAEVLLNSPAVLVLRWVQRAFPVLRPPGVHDSHPLMAPPRGLEVSL